MDKQYLKSIVDEINSDENKRRKFEHQKRAHVFNDYQREYVLQMLNKEFSAKTVSDMRTCTSINLTKKIITEMASIYKKEPERNFTEVTDDQHEAIELIYDAANADTKLKRANQKYKLHNQCAIQVIPSDGKIEIKILAPHQYDIIPSASDPEKPFAIIISALNKQQLDLQNSGSQDIQGHYYGSKNATASDGSNQSIADEEDYKASMDRYVMWTAEDNIVFNGHGDIIEHNPNPIGMLPFIDVANEKDFEFWVRKGSGVTEFSLDFSLVLSDTVNTNRLQSYAQAVIVAEKIPESITVGPQNILFLPIDPTRPEITPKFEFVSPQPDMKASLDLQDRLISYFLTSQGIDPKTIQSSGEGTKYTSGLERLLAMMEKFEASQDDIDLFKEVEVKLYELLKAWYGVLQGTDGLNPKYDFGQWPLNSELDIKFCGPEMITTESEKEDSVIKLLDNGLISKLEAIIKLRNVSIDEAKKILAEINTPNIDVNDTEGA